MHVTAIGPSGKPISKVNKPSDLYKLPGDPEPKKLEGQAALDWLKSLEN